jgi:hypothetical protein
MASAKVLTGVFRLDVATTPTPTTTLLQRLRCKFKVEWKLVECEQFEVTARLGSQRSLPELRHSGLAAAE